MQPGLVHDSAGITTGSLKMTDGFLQSNRSGRHALLALCMALLSTLAVSASEVRRRLLAGDLEGVGALVPESTMNFFKSQEGKELIETMRGNK